MGRPLLFARHDIKGRRECSASTFSLSHTNLAMFTSMMDFACNQYITLESLTSTKTDTARVCSHASPLSFGLVPSLFPSFRHNAWSTCLLTYRLETHLPWLTRSFLRTYLQPWWTTARLEYNISYEQWLPRCPRLRDVRRLLPPQLTVSNDCGILCTWISKVFLQREYPSKKFGIFG